MKKALPFLPAALFYGLIFFLSSRPMRLHIPLSHWDKWAHGAAYALLGFLLASGFFRILRASLKTRLVAVLLAGVSLGILDEIHQSFVPGRTPDALDVAADLAGVVLGLLLFRQVFWKKRQEKRP